MSAGDMAFPPRARHPRGVALPAAIFALVIIAALVTGGFFAARQEMRIGLNSRSSLSAFAAAEAGVNATIANWQSGTWNALAIGDSGMVSGSLGSGVVASTYTGSVRRLNTQLFLVRVTGQDRAGASQRTLAALTRLQPIPMSFRAALTTRGPTTLGGSASLNGRDTNPDGWNHCPATGLDTVAGLTLVEDSAFFQYGDLGWDELVAMATKVYPAGDVGPLHGLGPVGTTTTCSTSSPDNWGDPHHGAATAGCSTYFPIIHVNGDLRLDGGYGQGILLVSGDLEVTGGAEFYGPVIVKGSLRTTGAGARFIGGVMAANVELDPDADPGNAVIAYSSCALATALQASAPGRPVRERSWAEIF
jgi:hypothetical protein